MEPDPSARSGKQFYTVAEVAEILRVSENHVRAAIRRGEIPGRRIGRIYRIHVASFEAWQGGNTVNVRRQGWS